MAEIATIARPYAEATFRLAKENQSLDAWSEGLQFALAVSTNADMQRLAADPAFAKEKLIQLFSDICGKKLPADVSNFVHLLIENGRLSVLSEIVTQFEALKAKAGGIKDADVVSAYALTTAQQSALVAKLAAKFGCTVNVNVRVDPQLIGGVVITVGDEVYDASVRGKLQDMAYTLNR